jgi:hypothetical protein
VNLRVKICEKKVRGSIEERLEKLRASLKKRAGIGMLGGSLSPVQRQIRFISTFNNILRGVVGIRCTAREGGQQNTVQAIYCNVKVGLPNANRIFIVLHCYDWYPLMKCNAWSTYSTHAGLTLTPNWVPERTSNRQYSTP